MHAHVAWCCTESGINTKSATLPPFDYFSVYILTLCMTVTCDDKTSYLLQQKSVSDPPFLIFCLHLSVIFPATSTVSMLLVGWRPPHSLTYYIVYDNDICSGDFSQQLRAPGALWTGSPWCCFGSPMRLIYIRKKREVEKVGCGTVNKSRFQLNMRHHDSILWGRLGDSKAGNFTEMNCTVLHCAAL